MYELTKALAASSTDEALKNELNDLLAKAENGKVKIAEAVDKFIKTKTIIAPVAVTKGSTIKSLLADFKEAAKERGITNVRIDGDITGWFSNEKVSSTIASPSRLLRFTQDITHRDIIDGCKSLNAYAKYELSDAIIRSIELVKAGELDEKNNRGIIIYLKNKRNNVPCRLFVWRRGGGLLDLDVDRVYLGREWDAGDGVLCSNENFVS